MFQSFDAESDPSVGPPRVAALREWLAANDLDGFLVPRADEHQGEYVAKRSERLRWLTGFSGSAGVALILRDQAVIFVDGRYQLQVRGEVDTDAVCDRAPDRVAAADLYSREAGQGRADRLRPLAAHHRRGEGADGGRRQGGGRAGAGRRESDRPAVDGPAGAAAGAGGDPAARLRRRARQGEARPARRRLSPRKAPRIPC